MLEGQDSVGEEYGFTPWTEVWCFVDGTMEKRNNVVVGDLIWVCWRQELVLEKGGEKAGRTTLVGRKRAVSGRNGVKAVALIQAGWKIERKKTGDLRICKVTSPSGEVFRNLVEASKKFDRSGVETASNKIFETDGEGPVVSAETLAEAGWEIKRGKGGRLLMAISPEGKKFASVAESALEFKTSLNSMSPKPKENKYEVKKPKVKKAKAKAKAKVKVKVVKAKGKAGKAKRKVKKEVVKEKNKKRKRKVVEEKEPKKIFDPKGTYIWPEVGNVYTVKGGDGGQYWRPAKVVAVRKRVGLCVLDGTTYSSVGTWTTTVDIRDWDDNVKEKLGGETRGGRSVKRKVLDS